MTGENVHYRSKYEDIEYPEKLDTQCSLCGSPRMLDSDLCEECEEEVSRVSHDGESE